jgi:hypothetical protein
VQHTHVRNTVPNAFEQGMEYDEFEKNWDKRYISTVPLLRVFVFTQVVHAV